ncbi:MAG: YqgE/AlgH family protein [Tannerellaceae bacterium]|nr:YqgE/AlgH family protein [Tannerellaceae bacterium]
MAADNNIFTIKHNDVLPSRGSLLISEPFLQEAYFQRSVILLVEHNKEGSMGFVLNKQTDLIVNDFFPGLEHTPGIPIYLGGPVAPNKLFFIHSLGELIIPCSMPIGENLYFDGDFKVLKEYIQSGYNITDKVKFLLGYSGWEKGQLKNEIDSNSWIVSDKVNENIMKAHGEAFWKHSLECMGSKYKTWAKFPKDPGLN